MFCYKDRTFCASPNCKDECGRKLTPQTEIDAKEFGLPIAMGYFCGKPKEDE